MDVSSCKAILRAFLRGGKKPVLIERDGNIPPWDELEGEAAQALDIMTNVKAAA